ncbi:MAG TPA: hypothetical protein VM925_30170 [Labilithrix sp.]|nr:hypothetical protein [Labilithrix sp.]
MIWRRTDRAVLVWGVLAAAAALPTFASCAEAEDSRIPQEDTSVPLPEASVDATAPVEAAVEAGCDAKEPDCVSTVITCDVAAWCPVPTPVSTRFALTAVWGSSANDVWAVGSGGSIVHYDGAAWAATPTNVTNTFHAVWGSGPNDVWAVAMTDTILHSAGFSGGKADWQLVSGATNSAMATATTALWGTGAGKVRIGARARGVFVPGRGVVYQHQYTSRTEADGGIAWDLVEGEGDVLGFWGSSPNDLWLVADNSARKAWERGQTLHGIAGDGGVFDWTSVDSQSTVALEAIWGSSADDIWAVGDKGTMRRMKKGATRWEIVASSTERTLHGLWGSSADDVWAVGDAGTILHFDGATWKPSVAAFALGKKPDLRGVWGSAKNDVWIVGDNVALHYTGPKPAPQGGAQ